MKSKHLPAYCSSGRDLGGHAPEGIVVHYFSAKNVDIDRAMDMYACWDLFCDLNRARAERETYLLEDKWPDDRMYASAHILIGRDGETWKLVDFDKQAYHAGRSIMNGRENCNRWTLGVELVGDNKSGFTTVQYDELAKLCRLFQLEKEWIQGHDLVRHNAIEAGKATKRKNDPSGRSDGLGDNFAWDHLYQLLELRELPVDSVDETSLPAPDVDSVTE